MSVEVKFLDADDSTTIVAWHKNPGDKINSGEKLADVETAKATIEIEAEAGGVVKEILKQVGEAISSDDAIAIIDKD